VALFSAHALREGLIEQSATKAVKRRLGAMSALDSFIGEKLMHFADAARDDWPFARVHPRFLAAV